MRSSISSSRREIEKKKEEEEENQEYYREKSEIYRKIVVRTKVNERKEEEGAEAMEEA